MRKDRGVLATTKGDKGGDPERIFSKIEKEEVNKRYAAAMVEGGADMSIGGTEGKSSSHGVVKGR